MIAKLRGVLDSTGEEGAVIDVHGVGYLVFCSRRTLEALGAPGDPVAVLVDTHVREDHIHLYGFADRAERAWFRLLTSVQGVGPRVGLAILSVTAPDALATAIAAQDKAVLIRADGVGPKLATRILMELKDKAGQLALGAGAGTVPTRTTAAGGTGAAATAKAGTEGPDAAIGDAVSALVNLGYGRSEAMTAVHESVRAGGEAGDAPVTVQGLIPAALKRLAP